MSNRTFYLTETQYRWLAAALPQPQATTGRPAIANHSLLGGIIYVLKTGCRWEDIPVSLCGHHPSSCWRRFNWWRRRRSFVLTWQKLLAMLKQAGQLALQVGNLDGTLIPSPAFADGTGYSGKHHRHGTKVSLVTEQSGVPLAEVTAKGNRHDLSLASRTLAKIRVGAKRLLGTINADKGYDSRSFRRSLRDRGTAPNIPERVFAHRRIRGRKPAYNQAIAKFRPVVERTFAWLKYFRRLRYRWERTKRMFQAFVDLGCLLICLRRVGVLQ